ncbi:MAG: FKBP-type peptidyl-prolyl cis-trans isomerase [Brevinema sp.]
MKAKTGDAVKVHYKGTLSDGTVFDSSEGRDPLGFVLGQGHVIPGFDKGVEGMEVGEKKTVHIPCDEAYGKVVDEAVVEIPAGQRLVLLHPSSGEPMPVTIISAENGVLTLDGNHPLAGKDLNFDLTLDSIGELDEHDHKHGECGCNCGCDEH